MSSSGDPTIILDGGPPQPYHLVRPSAWPLIGAVAAGLTAFGLVRFMHADSSWLLILGILGIVFTMAGWWRDVIQESVVEKAHSAVAKIGLRYGMMLFIFSEVMFFSAFFWAYFDGNLFFGEAAQYARVEATGGEWPPAGTAAIDPYHLPLLMTMVLLLSGCTVTWAHHAILDGKNREAVQALGLTVALGAFFTCIQAYEYAHSTFGFGDNLYTSAFFMATGFHGFHVLVGSIFLAVIWWRTAKGHFSPQSHFGFEASAWYWHFVDVVWLFLFLGIYWVGAMGAAEVH